MQNRSRMPTNQKAFELSRTGSQTDLFAVIRNRGIDGSADNKAGPIICRGTAFDDYHCYYFFFIVVHFMKYFVSKSFARKVLSQYC